MERFFSYRLEPRPRILAYGIEWAGVPSLLRGAFAPGDAETVALPARLLGAVWDTVWTPSFPAVIFTGPGWGTLQEADRDLIWHRWGVAVYEQRLDAAGEILAEECDAHDALHIRPGKAHQESRSGRCACGFAGFLLPSDGGDLGRVDDDLLVHGRL